MATRLYTTMLLSLTHGSHFSNILFMFCFRTETGFAQVNWKSTELMLGEVARRATLFEARSSI